MANGHGGARPGAGRKKKALSEKIIDGNPGKAPLTKLQFGMKDTDMHGEDMPPVAEYLKQVTSFAANATISYIGNPVKKIAENHTNVSVEVTEENIQTIEEQMPLLDAKEEYIAKLRNKLHKKGLSRSARASIKNRIQKAMRKLKKYKQPIQEISKKVDETLNKKLNKWLGFESTLIDGIGSRASGDLTNIFSMGLDSAIGFYNAALKECTE